MLKALAVLLLFQLIGEVLVRLANLPIPGPVLGMALLFLKLSLRGGVSGSLRGVSQTLLANLSLLFVPAGVGVMLHVQRVAAEWPTILTALLVSTVLTLAVTALVMKAVLWISRRGGRT